MNESQGKAMIGLGSDTNYLKSLIIQKNVCFSLGLVSVLPCQCPAVLSVSTVQGRAKMVYYGVVLWCFSFGQGVVGRDIHHCLLNPNFEGIVCACLLFGGGRGIGI